MNKGTYDSAGKHQWDTDGAVQISDGSRKAFEGEIDLAWRSWKRDDYSKR
jgi:hypothetical protein